MTQLKREILKAIIYPLVAGVMAGGTFFLLRANGDALAALAAEHAANAVQHEASRKDRALLHEQLRIDKQVIARLLSEVEKRDEELKEKAKEQRP